MNPDDPLEQLKALKLSAGGPPPPAGGDPLDQLKALKPPTGNIDPRAQQESPAGMVDRARTQIFGDPAPTGDAGEGLLDRFLNMATVGLHRPIMGVGNAIEDISTHGLNAHPITSFKQGEQLTDQRMQAARQAAPTLATGADAAGFFSTLAVDAPLRAAIATRSALSKGLPMLPPAVDYAEGAPGVVPALKRIFQSGKTGAATGAVVGGLSSDGTPGQRLTSMGAGGVLGGTFGAGAQAAGEVGGGIKNIWDYLATPVEEQGELNANRRIVGKLAQGGMDPTDLLPAAASARAVGSPEMVAHLGGPSLDNVTWLAGTGPSADAAQLKAGVTQAQRGEVDLLQRGVTAMSGVPNTSGNQADMFLGTLDKARQTAGAADYPKAYAEPPIQDADLINAIRRDPDLRASLQEGIGVMKREQELARIKTGVKGAPITNPLTRPQSGPTFTPEGKQLQALGVPLDKLITEGHAILGEDEPVKPISIQLLDYMKQGVAPVIERGLKKGSLSAHDAGLINQKVQSILDMADPNAPAYATARARQAELFGQIEAGQAGTKAFDQAPEMISAQRADLTPSQENAYRTTQTSALRDKLNSKKYGNDLSTGLFDTPLIQGQLKASYADPGQLDPYLEHGRTLNRVNQAVSGNSKTAERQGAQGEVVDQTAIDAAHLLTAPHRAFYNLPAKLADARNKQVNFAMLQSLARTLNIPATSPELPDLIDRLIQASQTSAGRDVTATAGRRLAISRGGGILAGLLSGGATR